MKRMLSLLLTAVMLLTLCSCGGSGGKSTDSAYKKLLGDELGGGIYALKGLDTLDGLSDVAYCGDKMLAIYSENDSAHALIYDLKKGAITASGTGEDFDRFYAASATEMSAGRTVGLGDGGEIVLSDGESVRVYNSSFSRTAEFKLENPGSVAVSGDKVIVTGASDTADLYTFSGDRTSCTLTGTDASFEGTTDDGELIFTCYTENKKLVYAFVKDGKTTVTRPFDGINVRYAHGAVYSVGYDTSSVTRTEASNSSVSTVYSVGDGEYFDFLGASDGFFFVALGADQGQFAKISLKNGGEAARFAIDTSSESVISAHSRVLDDSTLLFAKRTSDGVTICVWVSGDDSESSGISGLGSAVNADIERICAGGKLSGTAINVYYGADVTEGFDGYTAAAESNSVTIRRALVELDSVIGKMPKGFIDEIADGFDGFELYLCGAISPAGSSSISDASAVTNSLGGTLRIALNVNLSPLGQNFVHELMHGIDSLIGQNSDDFFDWYELNPNSFRYFYGYVTSAGQTIDSSYSPDYTAESDKAMNYLLEGGDCPDIWFIDGYSKTYPTEDRARVFEHIFCDEPGEYWAFDSNKLRAKADRICEVLRDNFDSVKNCSDVYWERNLK